MNFVLVDSLGKKKSASDFDLALDPEQGASCACVLIGLIQTQSPRLILKNLMP